MQLLENTAQEVVVNEIEEEYKIINEKLREDIARAVSEAQEQ